MSLTFESRSEKPAAVLVPERDGGHVVADDLFGLLEDLHGLGGVGLGVGLVDELVEVLVRPLAVVGGGVRVVERLEEVLDEGVVHLPSGAEGAAHLAVADLGAEVRERADRVADAGLVVAECVVDRVADRVDPLFVRSGVRVVCDLDLSAGQPAALLDELLRGRGSYSQASPHRPSLKPPSSPSTGEVQSVAGVRVFWKIVSVICSRSIARDRPVRTLSEPVVFHFLS